MSRASAPLGTAYLPLFRWGQAGSHAHATWFTHSSPRMPGFRGESPLKMLRQWAGEKDCSSIGPWGQAARLGPINAVFWGLAIPECHRGITTTIKALHTGVKGSKQRPDFLEADLPMTATGEWIRVSQKPEPAQFSPTPPWDPTGIGHDIKGQGVLTKQTTVLRSGQTPPCHVPPKEPACKKCHPPHA